jgi:hypothetical protein
LSSFFPIGERIKDIAGVVERENVNTHAKHYSDEKRG